MKEQVVYFFISSCFLFVDEDAGGFIEESKLLLKLLRTIPLIYARFLCIFLKLFS